MFKSIRNIQSINTGMYVHTWTIVERAREGHCSKKSCSSVAGQQNSGTETHLSCRHRWCKIKINCRVPESHKERKAGSTAERCGGLATQRPHLLKLRFIAACLVQSAGRGWPASISCLLQRTVDENYTDILKAVCIRINYDTKKQNARAHTEWRGLKVLIQWQQTSFHPNRSSHAELTQRACRSAP